MYGATELKLQGGFKSSSIAFSRFSKREYKNAKTCFRSFGNPECRRITPRVLLFLGMRLFPEQGFRAPISYGNNGTASEGSEAVRKETLIYLGRYQKEVFQSV